MTKPELEARRRAYNKNPVVTMDHQLLFSRLFSTDNYLYYASLPIMDLKNDFNGNHLSTRRVLFIGRGRKFCIGRSLPPHPMLQK
jgi:acyl-CoA thioesterase